MHYSRLAAWIRTRLEDELGEHGWHCVVGETGGFHHCLGSTATTHTITIHPVTVLLFRLTSQSYNMKIHLNKPSI